MKKYEKFDKEIIKLSKEGKRPCEISKIIKWIIGFAMTVFSGLLTFKTLIASICSETLIVATSEANDEPIIEMIANPDMIMPASLIISIVIVMPTKFVPPCLTISFATCVATIIEVIPTIERVIGKDVTPNL